MEKQAVHAAALQFHATKPLIAAPLLPPVRKKRWSERATAELDAALELDLQSDRELRRKHVPSYERIATHLQAKGFD